MQLLQTVKDFFAKFTANFSPRKSLDDVVGDYGKLIPQLELVIEDGVVEQVLIAKEISALEVELETSKKDVEHARNVLENLRMVVPAAVVVERSPYYDTPSYEDAAEEAKNADDNNDDDEDADSPVPHYQDPVRVLQEPVGHDWARPESPQGEGAPTSNTPEVRQ